MRSKFKRITASVMAVMAIMAPCSMQIQSAFADEPTANTSSIKTEVEGTKAVENKSKLRACIHRRLKREKA